jgi:uncharacterized damage-inducible protein DinB
MIPEPGAANVSAAFLRRSSSLLTTDYLPKIERSIEGLTDDDVWWRANDASNSIGNLLLHLRGNTRQWIIGGIGGREDVRRRQEEFDERAHTPAAGLIAALEDVVREADRVIRAVDPAALPGMRRIQGYDVTVFDAIYHVVEHFSMHTGQIILLAKARSGRNLGLWQPPPGPRGA